MASARPYLHGRDALRITAALLNPSLRVVAAEDADCLVTFHCAHRAVAYVTHRTCVIGESATLIRPDQQTDAGREVWSGKINDRAGLIGDRPRGDDHVDLSIVQHGAPVFGANLFEDDLLVRIAEFGGHVFGDGDVEALVCAVMPCSHRWLVGCDPNGDGGPLRRSGDGGDLNLAATGQTG